MSEQDCLWNYAECEIDMNWRRQHAMHFFETYAHIIYTCTCVCVCVCFCSPASPFRHGPTTLPLMAKVYCTFVLCMAMFGLLIPKCSKPQRKRAQKNAKVRK